MTLERKFEVTPAYDKRSDGYGMGAATMRFYVIGPKGAVQFVFYTGWYCHTIKKTTFDDWSDWGEMQITRHDGDNLIATDLGYHSLTPKYEGQSLMDRECHILKAPCYYDGSSLNASKPLSILIHEGSDRLWEFLEGYYRETFEEAADEPPPQQ